MSSDARLNFGVIGAGRIGKIHAANLATRITGARLGAVADVDLSAAQSLAGHHQVTLVSRDHRDLLHDPAIDAVAICSATDTHSPFIQEAAKAGKHIFCEKPIDFDLDRIDAALQSVEESGVKFQVGFNRPPNFRRVHDLVAQGKVGQPQLLRITSRDPGPPPADYIKVSGGIFLDMTIHDFDMARFLMGDEVEEVYAAGAVLVDPQIGQLGDLDTALITLRFQSGAIGAIDNTAGDLQL
jgi:myo-inositol 2-dehydrogenase/D-chiro-inositol 1-dehydrogenase